MSAEDGDERLTELVERLQPLHPLRILLFGSSARGSADDRSDLDVIVVAERLAPRFLDRIADVYDLLDPRYALDVLVYTPQEYEAMLADDNPLLESAERDGKVLFARSAA